MSKINRIANINVYNTIDVFNSQQNYLTNYVVQELPSSRVITFTGAYRINSKFIKNEINIENIKANIDKEIINFFTTERGEYLREHAIDIKVDYYNAVVDDQQYNVYKYDIHITVTERDYAFYILKFQ